MPDAKKLVGALQALKQSLRESALMQSLPKVEQFSSWHGTPYTFSPTDANELGEFLDRAIGSGEGVQAFSYGHYTTGHKPLAIQYRDSLAARKVPSRQAYDRVTRGALRQVFPDAAYIPPQRFNQANANSLSDIGSWLADPDAGKIYDNMMPNPQWMERYVFAPGQKADEVVTSLPENVVEEIQSVVDSTNPKEWLSGDLISELRGMAKSYRQSTPSQIRGALNQLSSAEIDRIFASRGLTTPPTGALAKYYSKTPRSALSVLTDPDTSPWQMATVKMFPGVSDALSEAMGMPKWMVSSAYRSSPIFTLLGRNAQLDLAKEMSNPADLARLRSLFGVGKTITAREPAAKSLYEVGHNVSPADLWFLDSPLIGQKDDFISKFLEAGSAMSPAFGKRSALRNTGHDTYNWLKSVDTQGGPGLSSPRFSSQRNAEITDFLKKADVPGAMFLRAGRRDFDSVLKSPFNVDDYNFVTYDPSVTSILDRYQRGGLVQ